MQIRRSYRIYLPSSSPLPIKVWPGHHLRRRKKIQNCSCADACSFGGTIFGGWWIDSASKRKCCLHSCNFGFFSSCHRHCKVLKHFRKVFRRVKILSMLEVSFYLVSFHSKFSLSVKIIADESTFFLCMLGLHPTPTNRFEMSNS